jgi:AcrR family transcriptional regulator
MRESKAKKNILFTAEKMFKTIGFADLNVNEIARKAGVSIGTLYYHFPEGKISMLMEIRKRIADEYRERLVGRFEEETIKESGSFDAGFRKLLGALIEIHHDERLVLAAMESEVLSNLVVYDGVAESVRVEDLMESDAEPVVGIIESLLRAYPEDGLILEEKGAKINKVIDVLIHRFVYVKSMFGTQEEFVDMMIKIIHALLS